MLLRLKSIPHTLYPTNRFMKLSLKSFRKWGAINKNEQWFPYLLTWFYCVIYLFTCF